MKLFGATQSDIQDPASVRQDMPKYPSAEDTVAKELTALERVAKLDQERAKIIEEAKKAATEAANEAIESLNALGFEYYLAPGKAIRKAGKGSAKAAGDGPCPICEFKTAPAHDGRSHRHQGKHKKAFNKSELDELGIVKV